MPTNEELGKATDKLRLSIFALATGLKAHVSLPARLSWVASELERLSGEAFRLADEAEAPEGDPCREPIPGFPPKEE